MRFVEPGTCGVMLISQTCIQSVIMSGMESFTAFAESQSKYRYLTARTELKRPLGCWERLVDLRERVRKKFVEIQIITEFCDIKALKNKEKRTKNQTINKRICTFLNFFAHEC